MKDVMRFWLDAGCDGFRVDMAGSLVKNDDAKQSGTAALWRNVREMLDAEYPEAAMVAEWSRPEVSLPAGFHMNFLLSSENPGYQSLLRDYTLNPEELAIAYAVIFTLPGTPFLYYGDEIGMRYLNLPTKEGGYFRTGSRTPMQWRNAVSDTAGKNLGFSSADADKLYLPVDTAPDAPTVEAQEKESASLLNRVKSILRLRHAERDLQSVPNLEILYAEKGKLPFVYRRGSFIIAANPSGKDVEAPVKAQAKTATAVYAIGQCALTDGVCNMGAQSFGAWRV
jgi:maltose alpha-D-glucosyltransferase/alpha-amylase